MVLRKGALSAPRIVGVGDRASRGALRGAIGSCSGLGYMISRLVAAAEAGSTQTWFAHASFWPVWAVLWACG
jgi:hypothetical protein